MKNNIIQEIELKYNPPKRRSLVKIMSTGGIHELLMSIWNPETIDLFEEFKVLYLNRGGYIIGVNNHSKGGMSSTIADIRLIMAVALKCAASSIILAHNHPSGQLHPSSADKHLTKKIIEAAGLFEIQISDHLIVASDTYFSFADEGIL
jgi:hypothetical protein